MDQKPLLFSVIIPTLNEEHYLPYLLDDLTKQKTHNFEVIIVDATSEDNTLEKAKQYSSRLPLSINSVAKRNLSYQRNCGAEKARGEYLIFLDADMRIFPNFIGNLSREVHESKCLLFLPTLLPLGGNYSDVVLFKLVNLVVEFSQTFGKPFPTGGVMIFQKNFFHHLGGYKDNPTGNKFFPEDHDIIVRAHEAGVKAKYLRHVRAKFSLRRIEREGRLQSYRKYLVAALQIATKGKVDDQIEYEMGGHLYDEDDRIKMERVSVDQAIVRDIKQLLKNIMKALDEPISQT